MSAAQAEFSQHGFAGARVARIAQRARVNKQLIFYYFGSKAALYGQVAQRATDGVPTVVERAPNASGPGQLRALVTALFERLSADPSFVGLIRDARSGDESIAASSLDRIIAELGGTISAGQGLGYFRDDADPDLVARQAVVLIVGYLTLEWAMDAVPPVRRTQWVDGVSRTLARALTW